MASASVESKHDNATASFKLRSLDIAEEPLRMLLPISGYEEVALVSLKEAVISLASLLPKIEEYAWLALQNCEHPDDGLKQNESAAIMLYSMEWEPRDKCLYVVLNSILRDKKRTANTLKPWLLYLKLILTGLTKLPSSRHFLYRGVNLDLSVQYPIGRKLVWWGFSSCTTHVNVIEQFLGDQGERTMFIIDCYSGKDVRNHSFFETEHEVLLLPARYFEVVSSLKAGVNFHIIQLKEIEPDVSLLPPLLDISVSSMLDLSKQSITDDDIQRVVKQALIEKQCTQLKFNQNYITDIGLHYLANALRNNKVKISIHHKVTYKLHFLSKQAITELDLSENKITEQGARSLADSLANNQVITNMLSSYTH